MSNQRSGAARLGLGAAVVTALCAAVWAQQPTTRDVRPAPAASGRPLPDATLSGRITSASGGFPLARAEVRLVNEGKVVQFTTLTDAEGRWGFEGLVSGVQWTVIASKGGYVTRATGQRHPLQPSRPVRLVPGSNSLDFELVRAAAILGAVTDTLGDPVAGVLVQAMRPRVVRGRRLLSTVVASDLTDDTGSFRLHSLPAGDYYVSAKRVDTGNAPVVLPSTAAGAQSGTPLALSTDVQGRVPTYYPGSVDASGARLITVSAGEERNRIMFSIRSARAITVSGIVMDSAGGAARDATIALLRGDDLSEVSRSYGNFGLTQEGGRFVFVDVVPGSYVVYASVDRPGQTPETTFLPITAGDGDLENVAVRTAKGVTLSGTIVLPPDTSLPRATELKVIAYSGRGNATTADVSPTPVVARDATRGGTFVLDGLVGPNAFGVTGLPAGWSVSAIEANGADLADGTFDFTGGGQVPARVVLSNRSATVTGTVIENRRPLADADVVVFPGNIARAAYPSRLVQTARTDSAGRFSIAGLPAIDGYLAVALDYLDENEEQDTELLQRLADRATAFSLATGANALQLVVLHR